MSERLEPRSWALIQICLAQLLDQSRGSPLGIYSLITEEIRTPGKAASTLVWLVRLNVLSKTQEIQYGIYTCFAINILTTSFICLDLTYCTVDHGTPYYCVWQLTPRRFWLEVLHMNKVKSLILTRLGYRGFLSLSSRLNFHSRVWFKDVWSCRFRFPYCQLEKG